MADTDYPIISDGTTVYHAPLFDVGGGLYSRQNFDAATLAQTTVDYEHHEIHGGSHYFIAGYTTLDSAATDFIDFGVVTPDTTKWAHMVFEISSVGQVEFTIYEKASLFSASDGTAVTAYNNDRNSANTTGLTIVSNPSSFTAAASDAIFQQLLGKDGNVAQVQGGNSERNKEIILKQNTDYVFRIDSGTAGNVINYVAEWYEHTNKS
jgi:hypothetical protein